MSIYDKDDVVFVAANTVDVHPLVLLSVVDHFTRVNARAAVPRRVVGLLMGSFIKKDSTITLDINNCFAVPFDEDIRNPEVWFLDLNFAEEMFKMQRKVLPKAQIVGWYSSGPTISNNDMLLHTVIADRFCPNPVYCVVNTDTQKKGVPVLAYTATQGREGSQLEFRNIPTQLGSTEPEEIGIEQLLRDLSDTTVTTLSSKIGDRQLSLAQMETLLGTVEDYLRDVAGGSLPMTQDILSVVQELLSYQPQILKLKSSQSMVVSMNDESLATFVAATSRSVMALYDVIRNHRTLTREIADLQLKRSQDIAKKKRLEEAKAKREAEKAAEKESQRN
eukprot:GILI01012940.1.p1 GENE.GILI01012940.1~~GILI01012940.1.p1  ORF type:complete len:334 (-),score=71.08 GILI01012940.1:81-1082(-)